MYFEPFGWWPARLNEMWRRVLDSIDLATTWVAVTEITVFETSTCDNWDVIFAS